MRSAMVRGATSSGASNSDTMDDVDSPADELEPGILAIKDDGTTDTNELWTRPEWFQKVQPGENEKVLRFEILSANIAPQSNEKLNAKRYVQYKITVNIEGYKSPDPEPALLIRRYSDFLTMFDALKLEYPTLLQQFEFPKKKLMGNFTVELICERVMAFEKLLNYIITITELRESIAFLKFLEERELVEGCRLLDERKHELAVPIFENGLKKLNKILMDRSKPVLLMLLRLVVACTTSSIPHPAAEKWADLALKRYEAVCDADLLVLYVPLLKTCIHLFWLIGREKQDLENHLNDMEKRGFKVKDGPTLSQAILNVDPRT